MMELYGLVLSGGLSSRMGTDKGALIYERSGPSSGLNQRMRSFELLSGACEKVFISCRMEQESLIEAGLPVILDSILGSGPGVGIVSAAQIYPEHAWLVLACDFPFADEHDVAHLLQARSGGYAATCYVHADGVIEPLFSIWEREALKVLENRFQDFGQSPRRVLRSLRCREVEPLRDKSLLNINASKDLHESGFTWMPRKV